MPLLRVDAQSANCKCPSWGTSTLTTTPKGVQPVIAALWKRTEKDFAFSSPYPPRDVMLSLNFNFKSSVHRETIKELVFKPWERLHGIKELALVGNVGDSRKRHLERSMLERPVPTEIGLSLREYHSLGQKEMAQKNYTSAQG
jgi:hypothetical protein